MKEELGRMCVWLCNVVLKPGKLVLLRAAEGLPKALAAEGAAPSSPKHPSRTPPSPHPSSSSSPLRTFSGLENGRQRLVDPGSRGHDGEEVQLGAAHPHHKAHHEHVLDGALGLAEQSCLPRRHIR